MGFKPVVVNGLSHNLPFDFARALVSKKPEHVIRVGKREKTETWERLNVWDDDVVEHVAFRCPHATIDEIG